MKSPAATELASKLARAYPALAPAVAHRTREIELLAESLGRPRDADFWGIEAELLRAVAADPALFRSRLRSLATREKWRIAYRELDSRDIEATARGLSDLASFCLEHALEEAVAWANARFGIPAPASGNACRFVILGMGKLGGGELNAGSDVDLLFAYETDDGSVGSSEEVSLHEYFTRVFQRAVAHVDELTQDGQVWRVDLRLRPEGTRGPLVNSLPALERYYESWGRTWERAALLRAAPVAGDLGFGEEVLSALAPFIWRREVNPRIAGELDALLLRGRAGVGERDLKLGCGGIREVEFFVQSLQLIWGGRDVSLRARGTWTALRRLRSGGYVSDREEETFARGYEFLRRLEHQVQFATGLQTHALPEQQDLLETLARNLGYARWSAAERELARHRRAISERYSSLFGAQERTSAAIADLVPLWEALESGNEDDVLRALPSNMPRTADLARHLLALARRPDGPLGALSRDRAEESVIVLVRALFDSADPEQAARLLSAFFGRFRSTDTYLRSLAPKELTRLVNLFGASTLLGASLVAHPELFEEMSSNRSSWIPRRIVDLVRAEIADLAEPEDVELFVGALRRSKMRVTLGVGAADLGGELSPREVSHALVALADAQLSESLQFAQRERGLSSGLAVVALGKLGGGEIGYGSDLDLLFVYPEDTTDAEQEIRAAQRVLRLLSMPHGDGGGYELDTRLRPSGNQGLLVVSLDGFRRYHEREAQAWERQSLLKARFVAGDQALGERVVRLAHEVAFLRGPPDKLELHRLRTRMLDELSGDREGPSPRYDLKLGRGGLVEVEFIAQWLQMAHGSNEAVRVRETELALKALEREGFLSSASAQALLEAYALLRGWERRLRMQFGGSAPLLVEEGAPGAEVLARRLGFRGEGPSDGNASTELFRAIRSVRHAVRGEYERLFLSA